MEETNKLETQIEEEIKFVASEQWYDKWTRGELDGMLTSEIFVNAWVSAIDWYKQKIK